MTTEHKYTTSDAIDMLDRSRTEPAPATIGEIAFNDLLADNERLSAINAELLSALREFTAFGEKVNWAFFVDGSSNAMKKAFAGQKDLLIAARAAIAKTEGK